MFAAVTGTLFSKMAKSSLRGRRKQNNPQLDLWEFANRLTLHSKKKHLTALLELNQPKRNRMLSRVVLPCWKLLK